MILHVDADAAAIVRQLEEKGEAQVRLMMQTGAFPQHLNQIALNWLREKDHQRESLVGASRATDRRIAIIAAVAAVIAAVAAIASLIIEAIQSI